MLQKFVIDGVSVLATSYADARRIVRGGVVTGGILRELFPRDTARRRHSSQKMLVVSTTSA